MHEISENITLIRLCISLNSCKYLFITRMLICISKHTLQVFNHVFSLSEKGLPPFFKHCFEGDCLHGKFY